MPRTPNREHGELETEGIALDSVGTDPPADGGIRFNGSDFRMKDLLGVFNPRSGGGISEAQHEVLDTLVHELAETSYLEATRSGGQISAVTVWTNILKTTKIREALITRGGGQVTVVIEKQYNGAGTLVQTLTHTITRSGGQVASVATVEV